MDNFHDMILRFGNWLTKIIRKFASRPLSRGSIWYIRIQTCQIFGEKNGDVAVIGEGKYWKFPIDEMTEFDPEEQDWRVYSSDLDPLKIDI